MAKEEKKPSKDFEKAEPADIIKEAIAEHADIIDEAQKAIRPRQSRDDNIIDVTKPEGNL